MTETNSLIDALAATDARMVTFVGAGGKTSAIIRMAGEFSSRGRTVIATTTTLVGQRLADRGVSVLTCEVEQRLAAELALSGSVFLHAGRRDDGKFDGVRPDMLDSLVERCAADCILVEGDGARGLPIKMPDAHEPVIPTRSDIVVPIVGMDALDRRVEEGLVHRPRLFSTIAGDGTVTPETVVALLGSRSGGRKGVPAGAAVRPLLNKIGLPGGERADGIARTVLRSAPPELDRVLCADIRSGVIRVFVKEGVTAGAGPDRS